jgi:hypothetical protein
LTTVKETMPDKNEEAYDPAAVIVRPPLVNLEEDEENGAAQVDNPAANGVVDPEAEGGGAANGVGDGDGVAAPEAGLQAVEVRTEATAGCRLFYSVEN